MAKSTASSTSSRPLNPGVDEDEDDDEAYVASLAAQRNANAFFEKFNRTEMQEVLSLTSCNWLLSSEDFRLPVEAPSGIINQVKNFSYSNTVILVPVDAQVSLDYKEVHQIVKELVVGIYCFNQMPSLRLESNFDQSTTCQMPPAYYDTKVGQILISVDYMMKGLWHGAYIPKEKRVRFSELWRSSMDVDASGIPQTRKNLYPEFLAAGLVDISDDPAFHNMYSEDINTDPTYEPNSPEEVKIFMQYCDHFLLQLTSYLTSVKQHNNLFMYDGTYNIANTVRLIEDKMNPVIYQRLQKRLKLQEKLVTKYLQKKPEVRKNMAYVQLISFLVPFLIGLKKKMKIPDLSRLLPSFSDDKLKTERELPPLYHGPDFTCKHFQYEQNKYFHLHGGIEFDIGTPLLGDVSDEIKSAFEDLQCLAASHLSQLREQDTSYRENYSIPVVQFEGRSYYVISIELETFYQQFNKTQWWGAMLVLIKTLKIKRLPLNDIQLHEQFKKTFGYKKALKCKNLSYGLKSAAERGLSAIFHTFSRKNSPSRLGFFDEYGYSLIHYAAIHNQVPIISQLAMAGLQLNQRRSDKFISSDHLGEPALKTKFGVTALHLAAQYGSLEALHCLLALQVDYKMVDRRGWTAIHFAAFYGNVLCIQALYRKDPTLLEMESIAESRCTPLLLAAMSGSLDALRYLLSIGADWKKTDSKGNNVVQLGVLYFHTEMLKHLIELDLVELPVWKLLVEMLRCEDETKKDMSVRCLEVLCVAADTHWKDIIAAGGIPSLVDLLHSQQENLQCVAAAVLCNISNQVPVSLAVVECGAIPVLIQLLQTQCPELQSRCSVILADLAHINDNQTLVAKLGLIPPLVKLLHSDIEDVLLNVVNCIRVMCINNPANQSTVTQEGGITSLVEFLMLRSEVLQEAASTALAELARGHRQNQDAIATEGAVTPLVKIISGRKIDVQVKAAMALEAVADHNAAIQTAFLEKSVTKHLLRLLKVFQLEVREQGAVALWALAGQTLKQQKMMADEIGHNFIIDFVLSSSDKMQYVGCQAVIALSRDSKAHQDQICQNSGVGPLIRLLRNSRTTERTLLSVIKALGTMCIGVAHTNNPFSQKSIVEELAFPILVELLKHHKSPRVKVAVAETLACIVLRNTELQTVLMDTEGFSYTDVLELLQAQDKDICLLAGYALSLFAYNNTMQQFMILQNGGIPISIYEPFLQSGNEINMAKAAFQIVILAKVIVDVDQVTLSARGITILVQLLKSQSSKTVILTGRLLASLSHTRAGIPDAIVTMGAVEHLCAHLYSKSEEVRVATAVALGYLTFNRPAHRLLLVQCRNRPGLYNLLTQNLSNDAKISKIFTAEFKRQKLVGLPSQSLVINGGPHVMPQNKKDRPKTTSTMRDQDELQTDKHLRSKSAPVLVAQRCKTADSRRRIAASSRNNPESIHPAKSKILD
ncbi:ankyrin and armadillo repeat-containing protein [Acipenser ruthenus]|uniref:ankyrin and armadillo repeat-containing protein n=1 Tax=Acipenser ruthenus TaxID=7906 RepID=UPI0027403DB3|nr:ankyrin and armadillo repeat-containing protein [Acipenser ruthenus]